MDTMLCSMLPESDCSHDPACAFVPDEMLQVDSPHRCEIAYLSAALVGRGATPTVAALLGPRFSPTMVEGPHTGSETASLVGIKRNAAAAGRPRLAVSAPTGSTPICIAAGACQDHCVEAPAGESSLLTPA